METMLNSFLFKASKTANPLLQTSRVWATGIFLLPQFPHLLLTKPVIHNISDLKILPPPFVPIKVQTATFICSLRQEKNPNNLGS